MKSSAQEHLATAQHCMLQGTLHQRLPTLLLTVLHPYDLTWIPAACNQAALEQTAGLCFIPLCIHVVDVVGPGRQLCCIKRLHMEVRPPDDRLEGVSPRQLLLCALFGSAVTLSECL